VPPYRIDFIDRTNHMSQSSNTPAILKPSKRQRNLWMAMTSSFGKEVALLCDFLTTQESRKGFHALNRT
jgi:hypothetical protein